MRAAVECRGRCGMPAASGPGCAVISGWFDPMNQAGTGIVDWVLRRFEPAPQDVALEPGDELSLGTTPVRLPLRTHGLRLQMGGQTLDCHPDPLLVADAADGHALVIVDPHGQPRRPLACLRIGVGEERRLDADEREQHGMYTMPDEIRRRRPVVTHEGDTVVLRVAVTDPLSSVTALTAPRPRKTPRTNPSPVPSSPSSPASSRIIPKISRWVIPRARRLPISSGSTPANSW